MDAYRRNKFSSLITWSEVANQIILQYCKKCKWLFESKDKYNLKPVFNWVGGLFLAIFLPQLFEHTFPEHPISSDSRCPQPLGDPRNDFVALASPSKHKPTKWKESVLAKVKKKHNEHTTRFFLDNVEYFESSMCEFCMHNSTHRSGWEHRTPGPSIRSRIPWHCAVA